MLLPAVGSTPAGARLLTLPRFSKLHTKSVRNAEPPAGFKHFEIFLNLMRGADITGDGKSTSVSITNEMCGSTENTSVRQQPG